MKFRKKPVVIEAWQVGIGGELTKPQWLRDAIDEGRVYYQGGPLAEAYWTIETLEGSMRASFRDWIIRGVAGEIYPCKSDIFAQTYEPVEDALGEGQ